MNQVIVVPFNDQEIGQGFNFDSRENLGTGLSVSNISEDPVADGQIVRTAFVSVTTQSSLMESLGISASSDVRYGLFSGGAKLDFAESNSVNSYSSFIAGRCEVQNATKHGHGFQLTGAADAIVRTGDQKAFKRAFGDMFVRSLKTGGEFCVIARITSVSKEHQSKLASSLHAEYNGLTASGDFKGKFDQAMIETSNRTEISVSTSQAGGLGGQASFTGPDALKILERLSQFPQSAHDHPVGYEAELATYDTIPIAVLTPEENEDRNIVLADCLTQKMRFLKGLSDLQFVLGPTGADFFDNLPSEADLTKLEVQYRDALNGLMAHAIRVATGKMSPPQVFIANPEPPPLNFKRKPVSNDAKVNAANAGEEVAKNDPLVAAFRNLQPDGPRRLGFDMGVGITGGDSLWGPGKQRFLDSLSFQEQIGFKQAATFVIIRNSNSALATTGADIAAADPAVAAARTHVASGLYWVGFDIATGLFGDLALGGGGHTSTGPGSTKIRTGISQLEHVLLSTDFGAQGFDASVAFNIGHHK